MDFQSEDREVALRLQLLQVAQIALRRGELTRAEGYARRVLDLDPGNTTARHILTWALEGQGRHSDSIEMTLEALRRDPGDSELRANLTREWRRPILSGISALAFVVALITVLALLNFDQRSVALGLAVSAFAICGLTLAILEGRRRRFVGLGLSTRVEIEAQDHHARSDALRALGPFLAAIGLATFILVGAAAVLLAGRKPSVEMRVGDCFTLNERTSIEQVFKVPCSLPHGSEVYAVFANPAPQGAPFPGLDALRNSVRPKCVAAYQEYVGVPYDVGARL